MDQNESSVETFPDFTNIDRIIHEPARLTILAILSAVERADFLFLLKQTGLTRGNLSSHLRKLEEAGYVDIEKMFVEKLPRTLMSLTDGGKSAFDAYRERMLNTLDKLEP